MVEIGRVELLVSGKLETEINYFMHPLLNTCRPTLKHTVIVFIPC